MCSDQRFAPAPPVPVALEIAFGLFLLGSTFSIALTQTALGVALLLWLVFAVLRRAPAPRRTMLDIPLLAFVAVSLVAALHSSERAESFAHLKNYLLMSVIYLSASLVTTRRAALRYFAVLLASGTGVAAYGIAIYLLGKGAGTLGRTAGPFSNAMTFGGILLVLCSLALGVAVGPGVSIRLRRASAAAAGVCLVALFFSFTRSSWVGAVVSIAVILALLG
jgi:hypothetical protein